MLLQLYGRDSSYCIPNYSVVGNLLFDVVAQTSSRELSPFEKLFVVRSLGQTVHAGYLADVHLACGCFAEAREKYLKPEHPRKLGDICWCEGNFQEAELHYLKEKSEAQSYRSGPDEDRLIKLAFVQEDWDKLVKRFAAASFQKWNPPKEVALGSSVAKAQPFLDLLAVAIRQVNSQTNPKIVEILENVFGLTEKQWKSFLSKPTHAEAKTIAKLKARCRPRIGGVEALSEQDAINKGNTSRARHVASYIQNADANLELAQRSLERFAESGEEVDLERFLDNVTGSGIASLSHTFLFAALGHDSFPGHDGVPAERLIRLFGSHPIMEKRHSGKLLDLRFKGRHPLTASDVLTGIFQMLGRWVPSDDLKGSECDVILDIARLASCREWARIRLEEWISSGGKNAANDVAEIWRTGKAKPASHPFYVGVIGAPDSPRNMTEWNELMNDALTWLQKRWKREIGNSPWIAENQLYQILRRLLKGTEVIQHARPTWLEPQHLDVYVPQAGIAVEYMGQQHFEPLEFFGGEAAFKLVLERDKKKTELCASHGVQLIRVRFDEDVGLRAKEIAQQVSRTAKGG
jgi:hypothetical protein